jgi:hypothetical protein
MLLYAIKQASVQQRFKTKLISQTKKPRLDHLKSIQGFFAMYRSRQCWRLDT